MRPSSRGVMPRGPCDAAVGRGPPKPALVIGVGAARWYAGSLPASPPLEPGRLGNDRSALGGRPPDGPPDLSTTLRGGDGAAPWASRP
mmetsp:Transcript_7/g.34  ORF Transcript_7/g.34 Transcript_7/m.34 type:complete len:88 (+) Transcript_7:156-419(+)